MRSSAQECFENPSRPVRWSPGFAETRFVVQRQDEAVDLEQHLVFVGVRRSSPQSLHCSMARRMAACQVMTELASASRTGPVRSSNSTAPLM